MLGRWAAGLETLPPLAAALCIVAVALGIFATLAVLAAVLDAVGGRPWPRSQHRRRP
jgi:hypothetical protein